LSVFLAAFFARRSVEEVRIAVKASSGIPPSRTLNGKNGLPTTGTTFGADPSKNERAGE
jgi:hypothetical protein